MATLSAPVRRAVLDRVFREATGALLDARVRFAITGSFGAWARGAAPPALVEDIDVAVRERDIADAARALHAAGFRIEASPEGWLVKAFHAEANELGECVFVDLIHGLPGLPVTDAVLDRASPVYITAMAVPCLAPIDMMTTKLLVTGPVQLDFTEVMQQARLLREQFDWSELQRRAAGNPAALGFFDLARRLGVDPRHAPGEPMPVPNEPARGVRRLSAESLAAIRDLAAKGTEASDRSGPDLAASVRDELAAARNQG